MNFAPTVQVEKEETAPLAVIAGGGNLGRALKELLEKHHLRVVLTDKQTAPRAWDKVSYRFFFLNNRNLEEIEPEITAFSKQVIILDNLSPDREKTWIEDWEKKKLAGKLAVVKGAFDSEQENQAAGKLMRLVFSPDKQLTPLLITGREIKTSIPELSTVSEPSRQTQLSRLTRPDRPGRRLVVPHQVITGLGLLAIAGLLITGLLTIIFLPAGQAVISLKQTKDDFLAGRFVEAGREAAAAEENFSQTQGRLRKLTDFWGLAGNLNAPMRSTYDLIGTGVTVARVVGHLAKLTPKTISLIGGITGEKATVVTEADLATLRTELAALDQDLGVLIGEKRNVPAVLESYFADLPRWRSLLGKGNSLLAVWPDIIPPTGKKTYLVVLQNSAELRPTGGFIGSYGLIKLEQGRLKSTKIFDIYTADGQLRGHIPPPDEILHFLGQPSWYMRDANWSPDWPLTAQRLIWFLEKETGEKADGVIAVNLGAAQKILTATGPVQLPDINQTVSAADFFAKAEAASEINFFAGSTQKKDFLGAVAQALLNKLPANSPAQMGKLAQALAAALEEKEILFYFNAPAAQKTVVGNSWAGTLDDQRCLRLKNCLMMVEANVGANKANYFLQRGITVSTVISKAGEMDTTVTVRYQNNSPSDSWPGGRYKNYLRFLIPAGSKLTDVQTDDGKKAYVSTILTAEELKKTPAGEFFVFQDIVNVPNAWISFGTLIEVPVGQIKTVTFRFRPPASLDFKQNQVPFGFKMLKQPGMGDFSGEKSTPLDFSLDYPAFLTPQNSLGPPRPLAAFTPAPSEAGLAMPQRLIYNSDLTVDREFAVNFRNELKQ